MSIAWSTSFLSMSPSHVQWKVIWMDLNAFGHSSSRSPSTSTSIERRGCLNFLSSRTAFSPVQPPRAPSSISVGRIAAFSPKTGASSTWTVCPDADSTSNKTLLPVQRAVALVTAATIRVTW